MLCYFDENIASEDKTNTKINSHHTSLVDIQNTLLSQTTGHQLLELSISLLWNLDILFITRTDEHVRRILETSQEIPDIPKSWNHECLPWLLDITTAPPFSGNAFSLLATSTYSEYSAMWVDRCFNNLLAPYVRKLFENWPQPQYILVKSVRRFTLIVHFQ